jgi:hypothetical protein
VYPDLLFKVLVNAILKDLSSKILKHRDNLKYKDELLILRSFKKLTVIE